MIYSLFIDAKDDARVKEALLSHDPEARYSRCRSVLFVQSALEWDALRALLPGLLIGTANMTNLPTAGI